MSNTAPQRNTSNDLFDNASLVDLGNGWSACTAVTPAGRTAFWIVDPTDDTTATVAIPEHEQLGPLPASMLAAIQTAGLPRCGAPKRDGNPCRALVTHPGDHCRHHADRQQRLF